jgi:hypothetical protein
MATFDYPYKDLEVQLVNEMDSTCRSKILGAEFTLGHFFSIVQCSIPQFVSFQSTIRDLGDHSSPLMFITTLVSMWAQIGEIAYFARNHSLASTYVYPILFLKRPSKSSPDQNRSKNGLGSEVAP